MNCPPGRWLCPSNERCILEAWVCDGVNDCGDGADEDGSVCGTLFISFGCFGCFDVWMFNCIEHYLVTILKSCYVTRESFFG